jgi:dinuclear metal center YbgI/SA1388 family protein
MITVQDICSLLEDVAPLSYQEAYDNAGLMVGQRETAVTGVLICLDVTEPVIDEAIQLGYNLIVSHHPLIFNGLKNLTGPGRVEACLIKAIKHDLAIYASHTNMDAVINGVNGMMAKKIGLQQTRLLVSHPSEITEESYGSGLVGELVTKMDEISFLKLIKKQFNCQSIRHSDFTGKPVRRVAVCGGSGSEFLSQARSAGATVFLTGEAHYHDFFTEGLDIMLVDAGHFETEQFTKELFFELISKKFPTFAVRISTAEKNPVNYL